MIAQTADGPRDLSWWPRRFSTYSDRTTEITRLLIFGVPVIRGVRRAHHLVHRWPRLGARRGDSARDQRNRAGAIAPPGTATRGRRRDRATRRHHESHAREGWKARGKRSAPLRIRRVARVALADHHHSPAHQGRPCPSGPNDPRSWPMWCWPDDVGMQGLVEDLLLLARADEHAVSLSGAGRPRRPAAFEEGHRAPFDDLEAGRHPGVGHGAGARAMPTRCAGCSATWARTPRGTRRAGSNMRSRRSRRRHGADRSTTTARASRDPNGNRCCSASFGLDESRSRDDDGSGLGLVDRRRGGPGSRSARWWIAQSPLGGAHIQVTITCR